MIIVGPFVELIFRESFLCYRFTLLPYLFFTQLLWGIVLLGLFVSSLQHLYNYLAASIIEIVSIKLKNLLSRLISYYLHMLWVILLPILLNIGIIFYLKLDRLQLYVLTVLSNDNLLRRWVLLLLASIFLFLAMCPVWADLSYNPMYASKNMHYNKNGQNNYDNDAKDCDQLLIKHFFLIWDYCPIPLRKIEVIYYCCIVSLVDPIVSILKVTCLSTSINFRQSIFYEVCFL